jgi:hypothetical protein
MRPPAADCEWEIKVADDDANSRSYPESAHGRPSKKKALFGTGLN